MFGFAGIGSRAEKAPDQGMSANVDAGDGVGEGSWGVPPCNGLHREYTSWSPSASVALWFRKKSKFAQMAAGGMAVNTGLEFGFESPVFGGIWVVRVMPMSSGFWMFWMPGLRQQR